MVVVRVRQDDRVQSAKAARKQVPADHVFSDRESALILQSKESPCRDSSAVDQRSSAIREFDEDRVALTDIKKGHCRSRGRIGGKISNDQCALQAQEDSEGRNEE